ncbi:hypothetical protein ACFVIM_28360 [Streptomyces sp. NPDC057638]|uniref:hypothetical protein n=1 Tax=Streptomyces sp. NPDC057638 TaxID=3346190 RepID=UPI003696A389
MRVSRALAAAIAACAAVGLSAPLAAAGGGGQDQGPIHVSVHPRAVHQGGILTITVHGCNRGGTITSNAFPPVGVAPGRVDGGVGGDGRGGGAGGGDGRGDNRAGGNGGHGDNKGGVGGGDGREGGAGGGDGREGVGGRGGGNTSSALARIHDRTSPGHYNLAVRCHGNPSVGGAHFRVVRGRGALGGLGGSAGPSTTETAVGAGLVGVATVGAVVFIARRRRTVGGRV